MDSNAEKQKDPCLMKTQFLKPFVTSIDGPVAELPRNRRSVSSSDLKDSISRVSFTGFWSAGRNFKSWAKRMEALHEPTWRKAGIFEAIKASTYKIHESHSLISALVERWCPETKSFIFPWGEATVTLEDVMVLLGFSVLGSPVFAPLESPEMRDSVENLEKVRVETMNTASLSSAEKWILSFINRGDQMEHEAFLALWLSHFVFPDKSRRSISSNVLSIAVRLARGERIALAPAVLASLYRDLGQIQAFARDKSKQTVNLKSLFKLVQVWTWERFRNIRPEATKLQEREPRIAQWSDLQQRDEENLSLELDDFEWRPYTKRLKNWHRPRFYVKKAMWKTVDDEFLSFARCLRVSQLVGIGFVEGYYPNRVAMQFGLSQDLPGLVTHRSNITEKEAWDDYNKPLDGLKLYIPSRIAATLVTARYQHWWVKSVSEFLGSASKEPPLSRMFQKELVKRKREHLRNKRRKRAREDVETSMDYKEDDDGDEEDNNITIAQIIKSRKKTGGDASESLGKRKRHDGDSRLCQTLASEDETVTLKEIEQRSEENNQEETGSNAVEIVMIMIPSDGNNSSDPPLGSNGGVDNIVVSPSKTMQTCDDEFHVNKGSNAEKTVIDVDTIEPECSLKEDGEKQKCNEKLCSGAEKEEDDDDERSKWRKLAIEELALKLEASQEIEQRSEDSGSKAEEITVVIPSDENNSSDPPLSSNGGVTDLVMSPPKEKQTYDDELHVNKGSNAEKTTVIDVEPKEPECLLKEDGGNQRCDEKLCSEDDSIDERLKQRKLAIEELALKLEARIMKVENTLAEIRQWKTKRNQTRNGVSA